MKESEKIAYEYLSSIGWDVCLGYSKNPFESGYECGIPDFRNYNKKQYAEIKTPITGPAPHQLEKMRELFIDKNQIYLCYVLRDGYTLDYKNSDLFIFRLERIVKKKDEVFQ